MPELEMPMSAFAGQVNTNSDDYIIMLVNGLNAKVKKSDLLANAISENDYPLFFGYNTGPSLGFGGGWIGFNADRDENTGIWTVFSDSGVPPHNAGAIMFLNIASENKGSIFNIIEIPTSGDGSQDQIFTDAEIAAMPDILSEKANKNILINGYASDHTLALIDRSTLVRMNLTVSHAVTIPLNTDVPFPIGTRIRGSQIGTGVTTITPVSDVTINSLGGNRNTAGQWARWELIKTNTNEWELSGDLVG